MKRIRMARYARLILIGCGMTLAGLLAVGAVAVAADMLEPVLKDRGKHFQTEGKVVPVEKDGIHDPVNASVGYLQPPHVAMTDFPRDSAGLTNWVETVDKGLIAPRADLLGHAQMKLLDTDIIFADTGAMPKVRFPHKAHTEWLDCSNCHPAIFKQQKGTSNIAMTDVLQGQYCGVCHGKVAFAPTLNCMRCHSVP
ncbi:MAG: hypothetical protein FD165_590 [Gammaproteobacteria bacterium]|nr:MAG: hypothetical protein FD165_590 [Gammaproteobacteria bacterium]TND02148.1 MAG: hypothetical protein FD120_2312 [Gammaproteobacteria bacterium]